MSDNIEARKKEKGVRYSLSIIIPAGLTLCISNISFNKTLKSFILTVISATPLGIDFIIRQILKRHYQKIKNEELKKYENDIHDMLKDKNLSKEMKEICVNKLDRIKQIKIKTHENRISQIDNTLATFDN